MLAQLVEMLPPGSVACFCVINRPAVNPVIPASLSAMRIQYQDKPRERWNVFGGRRGAALSLAMETLIETVRIPMIARQAVRFGREFGADLVWCVLQGQTMIRLALPVAAGLGVPLHSHAWDPPNWWMRANNVDPRSARRVLDGFGAVLRGSRRFAAASQAMADSYHAAHGVPAIAVMPSLDESLIRPPAQRLTQGEEFRIGMAGQTYAMQEWDALLAALDSVDWTIAGRKVRIRLLGSYGAIRSSAKSFIEYLGWRPQKEAIERLAECDLLYCPYWFDPAFEVEARLSFPGKLSTYLAAGRPVLVHGPEYASPARFVATHDAGVCCHSLEAHDIIHALSELIADAARYARLTRNGNDVLRKLFTMKTMRSNFHEFLGWPPAQATP
jgi:glycosyltransferase involved in cell wall biosynthesis